MPGLPVRTPPRPPGYCTTPTPNTTAGTGGTGQKIRQPSTALTSLAALYGDSSSSEDEPDPPGTTPIEGNPTTTLRETELDERSAEISSVVVKDEKTTIPQEVPTTTGSVSHGANSGDSKTSFPVPVKVESEPNASPKEAFTVIRSEANRKSSSETSDSESDSGDGGDSSSGSDTISDSEDELDKVVKMKNGPRVKGEQRLSDLPPIEDLHISVPHDKCTPIGVVKSFVDPLVIVAGDPGTPALDLDSVLFLEQGDRALGKIFDVFGPVKEPHYCVRFNSKEHIDSSGIKCGMRVYCAPDTPHSSFILLAQLSRFRGTDASWKHDIEPPPDIVEFSDDEMENFAKRGGRRHVRGRGRGAAAFTGTPTIPAGASDSMPGRKRQFHLDQQPAAVPQNPFIPANVPGFRPRIPFHRGRGRGYNRPPIHGPNFYGQPRQQFPPSQPHPHEPQMPHPNSSADAFNQYWSTYWTNYYYQQPGFTQAPAPGSHFYQNQNSSFGAPPHLYPQPPLPPRPPRPS